MPQSRKSPIYSLCAGLHLEGLHAPISTHTRLHGAVRAQNRHHRAATRGQRFVGSRISCFIVTNHSPDRIQTDIANLTAILTHKQLHRLSVFQLPDLTAFTPSDYPLPENRDSSTRKYILQARESAYRRSTGLPPRYSFDHSQEEQEAQAALLASIEPSTGHSLLGDPGAPIPTHKTIKAKR